MRCIRFKMTPAGRRCAKYAGRKRSRSLRGFGEFAFGDFADFGAAKRSKACDPTVGLAVRAHSRSCPLVATAPRNPKYKPYKMSRDKMLSLAISKKAKSPPAAGKRAKKSSGKRGK